MTLADENTTIIGTQVGNKIKDMISVLIKYLFKQVIKYLDQKAEKSFKALEKKSPERIRTADIQHKDLDKFKVLAHQQGVKIYQIETDKYQVPTLKYDIRDEHKIVGIYKQIQEGYRIPDNKMRAFVEQFLDTEKVIDKVSKVTGFKKSDIEKEFHKNEHCQEESVLNQDFSFKAQDIYDKAVKEVTGKENTNDITTDLQQVRNRPTKETDTLSQRLENLKEKQSQASTKEKTNQKTRQKDMDKGMER